MFLSWDQETCKTSSFVVVAIHLRCYRPVILALFLVTLLSVPVPVTARTKAWVCGRSHAEIVGSNHNGGNVCLSVVSVVCYQVEVSATG